MVRSVLWWLNFGGNLTSLACRSQAQIGAWYVTLVRDRKIFCTLLRFLSTTFRTVCVNQSKQKYIFFYLVRSKMKTTRAFPPFVAIAQYVTNSDLVTAVLASFVVYFCLPYFNYRLVQQLEYLGAQAFYSWMASNSSLIFSFGCIIDLTCTVKIAIVLAVCFSLGTWICTGNDLGSDTRRD